MTLNDLENIEILLNSKKGEWNELTKDSEILKTVLKNKAIDEMLDLIRSYQKCEFEQDALDTLKKGY